jgi:hypothetical protein
MTRYFGAIVLGAMTTVSCANAMQNTHTTSTGTLAATSAAVPATPRRHLEPLEIDVYPRITSAQGDAWVRVRIEPDARSRSVDLEWFSADGGGGAHLITLEGERAAVRHQFPIKRLAAGKYDVTAVLTRNDGTTVRRTTTVLVVGPEGLSSAN